MTDFPAEYSLLFVMPEICRTFYLTLDPALRRQINDEIAAVIKDSIRLDAYKTWEAGEITAEDDGFKREEEVRRELSDLVRDLRRDGKPLVIPDNAGLVLWGSKGIKCGQDFHFAYSLHFPDDAGVLRPWIIPSPSFREIVFEVRVSVHWVGPAASVEVALTPEKRRNEPNALRRPGEKKPLGR